MIPCIDAGNSRFKCAIPDVTGNPKLITNRLGEPYTPSAVYFDTDGSIIVGNEALNAGFVEPNRLVTNWKRAMGTNQPLYTAEDVTVYHAMDILTILLKDAKANIEAKTGQVINEIVITVPANYNDLQKQQTIDAAQKAGMKVIALPHEPTAAALGNELYKKDNVIVVVYDLGGGTFDISIVEVKGNVFTILATGGDPNIGGRDFNDRIQEKLLEQFEAENGFRPSPNKHDTYFLELSQKIEQLKISLSAQNQAKIVLFCEGKTLQTTVTREQYADWVHDLVVKTIEKTDEVIKTANLDKSQIDELYAVGGGSMMPVIVESLEQLIGKKVSKRCEPHCAAAFGGILSGRLECQRQGKPYTHGNVVLPAPSTLIHEILSHTIGVLVLDEENREICSEILGQKTPVPSVQTKLFKLAQANQTAVTIKVLQGDDGQNADQCLALGHFDLNDLPPRGDLIGRIEITFSLDNNGLLTAKARDIVSGKEEQMEIDYDIKGKAA